jgi:Chlorophyll A-B binding protein
MKFLNIINLTNKGLTSRPARVPVIGRFTVDAEVAHGRLAMLGLAGSFATCRLAPQHPGLIAQVDAALSLASVPLPYAVAAVSLVTAGFIAHAANPTTQRSQEDAVPVWDNPGWTIESEVLNGRLAMLAFSYVLIADALYGKVVL